MKEFNGLNTYDNEIIPVEHRKIIKYALFAFIFFEVVFTILTIFFNFLYTLIIGFAIGGVASLILFYITHKIVDQTHYTSYKKMMKRIHVIYQITYATIYVVLAVTFKSFYPIIGVTLGFILIKIASLLYRIFMKKD